MTVARDELITLGEAARVLRVHIQTIRAWARKGAVRVVKVGPHRLKRIRRSELARHIVEDA